MIDYNLEVKNLLERMETAENPAIELLNAWGYYKPLFGGVGENNDSPCLTQIAFGGEFVPTKLITLEEEIRDNYNINMELLETMPLAEWMLYHNIENIEGFLQSFADMQSKIRDLKMEQQTTLIFC